MVELDTAIYKKCPHCAKRVFDIEHSGTYALNYHIWVNVRLESQDIKPEKKVIKKIGDIIYRDGKIISYRKLTKIDKIRVDKELKALEDEKQEKSKNLQF